MTITNTRQENGEQGEQDVIVTLEASDEMDEAIESIIVTRDFPDGEADDGSCDPLYGRRMDDADLGRN